jgi:bacteriocin-like protein
MRYTIAFNLFKSKFNYRKMKTINIEEMEQIEGGISLAAFGCGLGLVAVLAGQEYLLPTTAALCGAAMNE